MTKVEGHYDRDGLIGSRIRAFHWYQNQRLWMTLNGVPTVCPKFLSTRYYHRNGLSYRLQIYMSSLKILEKRERGRI